MDNTEDSLNYKYTGYIAVFCAMMVNLMIGSYYMISNINPYIAAYLHQFDNTITNKDTLLIVPIWLINQSVFSIVGVKLSEKLGYARVNLMAFAGYTLVNGLMIYVKNYWLFVVVYGFMTGMTVGLGYLPSMYIAWTYFPEKKSMVTGIILFTAGISASILSPITTMIVNPHNLPDYSTNPAVYNNVPKMFTFLFFYFGILTFIACGLQPLPYVSLMYQEKKQIEREEMEQKKRPSMLRAPSMNNFNKSFKSVRSFKSVASSYYGGQSRRMSISNQLMMELDPKTIRVYHNEELKNDMNGVVDSSTALLMANMETDKVVDLVQHRKSMQLEKLVANQRKSIKISPDKSFMDAEEELEEYTQKLIETNKKSIYHKSVQLLNAECPSVKFGLKSGVYFKIAVMAFGCSIANYFLNSVWKDFYRTKFQVDDDKMALLLSMGGFSNSFARLLAGALLMRVSFRRIYLVLATIVIFLCLTINFFVRSYAVGAFYLLLVFGGIGTQVTIFPTVTTKAFGATTGPKIYPFVYLIFSLANIFQYVVLKFFNNWSLMFYFFGVFAVAGLVVGISFNENPDWRNSNPEVVSMHEMDVVRRNDLDEKILPEEGFEEPRK